MIQIKVLGTGCSKCAVTYNHVVEAVKQLNLEASVNKIEDIMEIMKYDVITTPVLVINEEIKVKGRIPDVKEIITLLQTTSK